MSSRILITCDGAWRGVKLIRLKELANEAMDILSKRGKPLNHCVVLQHITRSPSDPDQIVSGDERPGKRPCLSHSA
ncbi:unnamed protein product [Protopolystoma xenopodis]|uniref:Uncharacterized protein n=1 Tax=Protopolystoma xenopodis TaxID=117903 RepID=A0A448W9S7_9PLAT|nr:unnamed protein product [Protopolystoma xenopodis]